ncbi:RNA polymerase sigma factor [Spirosoma terrae]|uniref:RNA polymerase sigma factor n=1 Tax=Spirosoma terrae TaxID=1968276 RepID=A0A6L9LF84_9BACT|nr:RNA polymerase sigma factor [Spirosoma terrae]NDU97158.1 RNA polymerase sigma factor [Spirosoma terrae]
MNHLVKDEELIRLYLNTHRNDYFEILYKRYVTKVYKRCLSLTKDSVQAEDFTQDIFLRVHGNLTNFKENSAFSTWLYSISYNYCMDQIRYSNRSNTVYLSENQDFVWPDSSDQEIRENQLQHLDNVIGTISPEETQMLRMKYTDGLDINEIAEALQLKNSAVKMRLKRTRDKIRRLYGDQFFY